MSKSNTPPVRQAVALHYGANDVAPVLVASGMGFLAEKIVEVAVENGVPIYEDSSLASVLMQLELGQEIPESLYQVIVDIYLYFLEFDPSTRETAHSKEKVQVSVDALAEEKEEV